ncbi:MAG: PAS domain S-box protein, partial [Thermotogota bacterium]|nr:PAS domain S-box protein [Thermotogota bacterium]
MEEANKGKPAKADKGKNGVHSIGDKKTMNNKMFHPGDNLSLPMDYMRLVLENSHEMITIIQNEQYQFVNQKVVENRGYSPEEMYNKHIKDIVHPEDYERIKGNFYKRLRGELVEKYPYRIIDKFGNIRWEELSGVEVLWNGKPAALNFITDITRRVHAEEALKKSERQLFDIVNFLPDAMFAIDVEGKVIAWNMRMEKLSGVKAADMVGKGDYEYALPFYGERRPMLINLISQPDASIERNYTYLKRDKNSLGAETFFENGGTSLSLWSEA